MGLKEGFFWRGRILENSRRLSSQNNPPPLDKREKELNRVRDEPSSSPEARSADAAEKKNTANIFP